MYIFQFPPLRLRGRPTLSSSSPEPTRESEVCCDTRNIELPHHTKRTVYTVARGGGHSGGLLEPAHNHAGGKFGGRLDADQKKYRVYFLPRCQGKIHQNVL